MRTGWAFLALLLAACSTGAVAAPTGNSNVVPEPSVDAGAPLPAEPDAPDAGEPPPLPPPPSPEPLRLRHERAFARKVLPAGDGYVVLFDAPVLLREAWGLPSRTLARVSARGEERLLHAPREGRQLIDVATHPSGEITALEASTDGWFLLRFGRDDRLLGETHVVDDAILTDPPAITPAESTSPIEARTHDTGRIAADGENIFGGLRTGRHSVVAYRWAWNGSAHEPTTRTLIVPAHAIAATALHGGSYDTFGQLEAHYGVFVGVDSAHIGYVGVSHARMESGAMAKAHQKVFGQPLPAADPDWLDTWVTRVSAHGKRMGTSVVGTEDYEQLYELRGAAHGVYALGRSEHWNAEGTGFDALAAHVAPDGQVTMRRFDVSRGDIAFDAVEEADGAILVAGASGYSQNPNGASIVEESQSFVRRLHPDGRIEAIALPTGPRHNEARFLLPIANALLVAGMTDGPGTHSADGDPALLRATGWLEAIGVSSLR